MANDQLFLELFKPEIMRIGWHLAQGDSRDDFVRDPIGNADYANDLSLRLGYLVEQIQAHRYRPRHLIEVDVPKSGLSVRPGNVLPIEESSILHAVIYLLAPKLDKKLDSSVYSYRLHPKWEEKAKKGQSLFREVETDFPFLKSKTIYAISPFEAWYERWPAFEEDSKKAYETEKFTHLTKTDIFSFFEHIDLRMLHDLIRTLLKTEEEKILQLLFTILGGWTRPSTLGMPLTRGIPQGNDVSSFLGNIYLIPLDRALIKFCKRKNAKWFRYVDDVKIYTHSEVDAREAVFEINNALRQMHLNLQGAKTEILSGEKLIQEHDNTKLDQVNQIYDKFKKISNKSKSKKKITEDLKQISGLLKPFTNKLPESIRGLKGKENRLYRRLLATYGIVSRTRKGLYESVFAAVKELPDLRVLRSCLSYLSRQEIKHHEMIIEELLSTLEKGDLLFPYQIASVLETMVQLHPNKPQAIGSRIRKFVFGANLAKKTNWLVIQKGLEALVSFPYKKKYIIKIALHYAKHDHPMVRRAAITVLPRGLEKSVRLHLAEFSRHPDSSMARLAQYFQQLCSDENYSLKEMANIRKGNLNENSLVRRLPQLYAGSATNNSIIAKEVRKTLEVLERTKSEKIKWHRKELLDRTEWCLVQPLAKT